MPSLFLGPTPPLMATLVRHYEELVAHVWRGPVARWSDAAMAREVVHDVCAELIERPPAPPRTPLAFLRTVCTRRAIDRCRIEQRHAQWTGSAGTLPDVALPDSHDPARILEGRQRLALLADCIHALPPRRRDVFVMHRIHGMAQQDIARHLGISLKTVEKHLALGTAACRGAMDQALHDLAAP